MEAAVIIVVASAIGDLRDLLPNRDIFGFLILLPLMWAGLRGSNVMPRPPHSSLAVR
jgi:hypothetical protein